MAKRRPNGEGSYYQRPNGKWVYSASIGGKRVTGMAQTQKGAKASWQRKADAAKRGTGTYKDAATVSALLDAWFRDETTELQYKTRQQYESLIRLYIVPRMGRKKFIDLTVMDVEQFQRSLEHEGIGYTTVRLCTVVLSGALTMALRHGAISVNPVASARPLKKPESKPMSVLTKEQARHLLLSSASPQEHVRNLLALTLGLRQGEMLGLRWQDVHLEGPEPFLAIEHSLERRTGQGLVLKATKTPSSRANLRLTPAHVMALRRQQEAQEEMRALFGPDWNSAGMVLPSPTGKPLDATNDRKHWHASLRAAGLPLFRVHSARHTCATEMLNAGMNPYHVQKVLRHTSIRTTVDIYGNHGTAAAADAIGSLTDLLTA